MSLERAIIDMLLTYQELNSVHVDEIYEEPSPLEFMRYVGKNRPFVLRQAGLRHWPALRRWSVSYLKERMGDAFVNVAVTPTGNADAVALNNVDGVEYFVKPLEIEESFGTFLDFVRAQELGNSTQSRVKYAQTQDDNLRGEYHNLYQDVDEDISWARLALGRKPDAINLWIGNSQSITALHRDHYENIYCQILGVKHFVLLPPAEAPCINQKSMRCATYAVNSSVDYDKDDMVIVPDEPPETVPCAIWDPDVPFERPTCFSHLSKPLRIDLRPGDMLYLPALWYHKVSQSCSEEGICCAVNYWYDMDFEGPLASFSSFLQNIGQVGESEAASWHA